MSARDAILSAVRRNRPAGEHPLPDLPRFRLPEPEGRQAKICSWMLILTGQTLVQEPFRVEANGNDEYLCRSMVGSRMTPMGPG